MTAQETDKKSHVKVVATASGVAAGMLLFVYFVLVPMYYLICEWTGITGSTFDVVEPQAFQVDTTRPITVQFMAINNATMSWQFRPMQMEVVAYPGELVQVAYYAKNQSRRDMTAQAVPSLTPFEATNYFLKTECFCFNQQPLAAGEEAEMGLVFQIDPDLPEWVETISMSYTLFDITDSIDTAYLTD